MKKNLHPNWISNSKILVNGKQVAEIGSTQKEINLVIWSGNHPFYTGEQQLVDTDNLVEKFNSRLNSSKIMLTNNAKKIQKRKSRIEKRKTISASNPVTLKDMLKNIG